MLEEPFAVEREHSENDVNCSALEKQIQRDGNNHIYLESFGLYISCHRHWETGLGPTFSPAFLLVERVEGSLLTTQKSMLEITGSA